jgi:hypothetical protein
MMDVLNWLSQLPPAVFVRESNSLFAFPGFLFVHTVGIAIVAGGSAIIAFALLGMWPAASVKPLERLYPIIWFGFWINFITGVGLLIADATSKGPNPILWIKLVFVVGGVTVMVRLRKTYFRAPDVDRPVPAGAKVLAWASLVCWFGAIIFGRLIAYVGGYQGPV